MGEAAPVELVFGLRNPAQVAQRGIKVHELRQRGGFAGFFPGNADDERHARRRVHQIVFPDEAVFAQIPAVVAQQHDDRAVRQAERVERVEHFPDLRVDVAEAGVVAVAHFPQERFVARVFRGDARVGADFGGIAHLGGQIFRAGTVRRERDFFPVVKIPVFFRRVEGQVRLPETAGVEEGFAGVPEAAQVGGCARGELAVVVGFIGNVGGFAERPAHGFRIDEFSRLRVLPKFPAVVFRPIHVVAVGMRAERRLAPGVGAVFDVVENFSRGHRAVAEALEPGGKRDGLRAVFVRARGEAREAVRPARVDAGEQARARSAAHGNVAVGVPEHDAARGEAVDAGRADFLHAVAAQFGAHVVRHQKKHVHGGARFAFRFRRGNGQGADETGEKETFCGTGAELFHRRTFYRFRFRCATGKISVPAEASTRYNRALL